MRGLRYIKTVRAKGRQYLYFDTGTTRDGKPVYKRLPHPKDPTFGAVYAAMLGHRTRRGAGVLTVPMLVAEYQASPKFAKLSDATKKLYRIYQGRFAEMLPTAPAGAIERTDIVRLFDIMDATPGAANMMLASVSALYRWGRRGGHVFNRPTDDITENDLGEHAPWPDDLLTAALASEDQTVRLAVHLLYYTAQRIGDVAAMRWAQVSGDAITMRQTKTGKDLHIPFHPALTAELARYPRDLRTIVTDPKGKTIPADRLRRVIQAWARGQGHKIVPHGLRKNAVNALLECGCTMAETAAISGQSLRMVEHYAKQRNQTKLAKSAIKLWGGTDGEPSNF